MNLFRRITWMLLFASAAACSLLTNLDELRGTEPDGSLEGSTSDATLRDAPIEDALADAHVGGDSEASDVITADDASDAAVEASSTCGEQTCTSLETCCSSACVDTTSDDLNCGDCGVTCNDAETCARSVCVNCGAIDVGTCAHSPCVPGGKLYGGCDPEGIVGSICLLKDPTCCSTAWNSACIGFAIALENASCGGCPADAAVVDP